MNTLKKLLVTGGGTGYSPIAPGTAGSVPPVLIWAALTAWVGGLLAPAMAMLLLAGLCSLICVKLGGFAERAFGKKDPGAVTIDEWAGQAVALIALPVPTDVQGLWITAAAAFFAFRVFDIVKPPPANQLQKLPGGVGILIDDLIAGVYANIACQLILRLTALGG